VRTHETIIRETLPKDILGAEVETSRTETEGQMLERSEFSDSIDNLKDVVVVFG
jgi:hypothetical protein